MTFVNNWLTFETGRRAYAPNLVDLKRVGDVLELTYAFDATRETVARANAVDATRFWKICRVRGERCLLDDSRTRLIVPTGIFVADQAIAEVVQVASHFFVFYRTGVPPTPIDCVLPSGERLWRLPYVYYAMDAVADTDLVLLAPHGPLGQRMSGLTGAIVGEFIQH